MRPSVSQPMHALQTIFCTAESAVTVGIVEAKVATYLQPVTLQWASGSNKGAQHRGDLPPLAIQLSGGKVEASGWLVEARTSEAESLEAQTRVRG